VHGVGHSTSSAPEVLLHAKPYSNSLAAAIDGSPSPGLPRACAWEPCEIRDHGLIYWKMTNGLVSGQSIEGADRLATSHSVHMILAEKFSYANDERRLLSMVGHCHM
jgi:hypothetical protein